jgi:2-C-methyl-D-erythritol 4-phosphate cytidylyltransferase
VKKYAIIVAGGTGTRMHTGIPKQFMPLGGIPMLSYSIMAFHEQDHETEIIVVLPEGYADQWKKLVHETHLSIPHKTVQGGHERFYSVANALNLIHPHEGLVAVHDAARPFVTKGLISRAFAHAIHFGNAIPGIPVKDSLRVKVLDDWTVADRMLFRVIQTPQVFDLERLKAAYRQAYKTKFTDDATVYEEAGNLIQIIDGEDLNFKITTPADLDYADYLLTNRQSLSSRVE